VEERDRKRGVERDGKREGGEKRRGRKKGVEKGETRHTNPSLLAAPRNDRIVVVYNITITDLPCRC